jgi:hypothetical protein
LDYYLHTAAADQLIAQRPSRYAASYLPPAAGPQLASQKEAVAWLEAERANPHACADHAVSHALAVHAVWIPAQLSEFLRTHGYLDQALTLHHSWSGAG